MSDTDRSDPATTAGGRLVNQRADAPRNQIAALAATPAALRKNPDASVADIAAAAGVGWMTLYGHFRTRAELIEAVAVESLDRGDVLLSEVRLDGEPGHALGEPRRVELESRRSGAWTARSSPNSRGAPRSRGAGARPARTGTARTNVPRRPAGELVARHGSRRHERRRRGDRSWTCSAGRRALHQCRRATGLRPCSAIGNGACLINPTSKENPDVR